MLVEKLVRQSLYNMCHQCNCFFTVLMSTALGLPLLLRAGPAAAFLDFLWSIPVTGQPSALHPSSVFDLFL